MKLHTFISVLLIFIFAVPEADAQRRRRRRGWGKLEINSMTTGATVQVNGKVMGKLPLAKPLRLRAGKHTLKITKRGYTEYLDVVKIRRNKTTSEDIDLLPFAGILIITSTVPKAQIYIDGKFVGRSPMEKELLAGEHTVKVRKPGHFDYLRTIKSIAGSVVRLRVNLKLMPVGTTPYRPPPPPPPKWYEKWYVWAGAAGGVVAVTLAIVIPVAVLSGDKVDDFSPEHRFSAAGLTFK